MVVILTLLPILQLAIDLTETLIILGSAASIGVIIWSLGNRLKKTLSIE
jgi:hypothetical protein